MYEDKVNKIGESIKVFERVILLKIVDSKWMDHIDEMDDLKKGIGLRAYAQKDPVVQYRIEGGDMFEEMISQIKLDVAKVILHLDHPKMNPEMNQNNVKITSTGLDLSAMNNGTTNNEMPKNNVAEKRQPVVNNGPKVGRNDPCPCGSGKKYKQCCGK
jgi:preprotein translocase subunit SecA